VEIVNFFRYFRANVNARGQNGGTPLHAAAKYGQLETVKLLLDMGSNIPARTNDGGTALFYAESEGHEAVVSFLRQIVKNKRRVKATTAPVVDPANQAAAEVAAAAMAALLIAEEDDHKQPPPSKQGNSKKARKHNNRRKSTLDEMNIGSKGHNEANSGSVAKSSGIKRDSVGERDDTERDAARYSTPNGEMDTHSGENNADPVFSNYGQGHNEPAGSIGRNVQQGEAHSVECEAGTSDSGVEQPTTTQAERQQQKERRGEGAEGQATATEKGNHTGNT
jgi:hypothetical protein